MKITIISYDYWGYDAHIAKALQELGQDAVHISLGEVGYKNPWERIKNFLYKNLLGKNLKKHKREKHLFDTLERRGLQDNILIINPELFSAKCHEKIKKYARCYTAYLYDSVAQNPVEHLLNEFDKVFSFDKQDCEKFGFTPITNFNYLNFPAQAPAISPKYDLVYLSSFDERIAVLKRVIGQFPALHLSYLATIVGKKSWIKKLLCFLRFSNQKCHITYKIQKIPHAKLPEYYSQGKVILDLVRSEQCGLSFRIFEAMALQRKIITNNLQVKKYDFYHPNNIFVLEENLKIDPDFFTTPYQELPQEIYQKYTIENWIKKVFNL